MTTTIALLILGAKVTIRSSWPIRPTLGSQQQSRYFGSLECILTTTASNTSTIVYAFTSNRSPMGSTFIILWTKKLTMGTPVTETLAPVMGWINTNALSKLLHLPLRCFDSFIYCICWIVEPLIILFLRI